MQLSGNIQARQTRFPGLAGLRFLFILVIVYFHAYSLIGSSEPGRVALFFRNYGGTLGNQLFFTLSGFLIAHSYQRAILDGAMDFPSFFKRRLLSLYPLYFIAVCVGIGLSFLWSGFDYVNFKNVILDLLMLSTGWFGTLQRYNSPLWFACVIMQCYLVFYALCCFSRKNPRRVIYGYGLLALLGYSMMVGIWQGPLNNWWTGQGVHSFFLGCLLHAFYMSASKVVCRRATYIGFVLLLISLVLSIPVGFQRVIGDSFLYFTLLVSPTVLLLCLEQPFVVRILGSRLFSWLGSLSTAIFMCHYLLYDLLYWGFYQYGRFFNGYSPLVRTGVYFTLLFLLCILSHILVEQKLGKYLRSKIFPHSC